jgi:hypothetical protein
LYFQCRQNCITAIGFLCLHNLPAHGILHRWNEVHITDALFVPLTIPYVAPLWILSHVIKPNVRDCRRRCNSPPPGRADRSRDRRQGRRDRAAAGGAVLRRACAAGRCAGHRQDDAGQDAGALARLHLQPHPVHARPAAQRHHRRQHLQPEDGRLRVSRRADPGARWCWPTRSTAPARAHNRLCSRRWRSARSRSTA